MVSQAANWMVSIPQKFVIVSNEYITHPTSQYNLTQTQMLNSVWELEIFPELNSCYFQNKIDTMDMYEPGSPLYPVSAWVWSLILVQAEPRPIVLINCHLQSVENNFIFI